MILIFQLKLLATAVDHVQHCPSRRPLSDPLRCSDTQGTSAGLLKSNRQGSKEDDNNRRVNPWGFHVYLVRIGGLTGSTWTLSERIIATLQTYGSYTDLIMGILGLMEVILIWLWGFSGTLTLILQDPGGNEGLCIRDQCNVSTSFYHSFCLVLSIDDLIKALSITGRGVYHGNVGFINGMGEKWGRQGTIVSYLVWSEVQSNDNKTKRVP